jgi:hypothetical protein
VKTPISDLPNLFIIPLIVVHEAITSSITHIFSFGLIFWMTSKSSSLIFIPLGDKPESFLLIDGRISFFSFGTSILVHFQKI